MFAKMLASFTDTTFEALKSSSFFHYSTLCAQLFYIWSPILLFWMKSLYVRLSWNAGLDISEGPSPSLLGSSTFYKYLAIKFWMKTGIVIVSGIVLILLSSWFSIWATLYRIIACLYSRGGIRRSWSPAWSRLCFRSSLLFIENEMFLSDILNLF